MICSCGSSWWCRRICFAVYWCCQSVGFLWIRISALYSDLWWPKQSGNYVGHISASLFSFPFHLCTLEICANNHSRKFDESVNHYRRFVEPWWALRVVHLKLCYRWTILHEILLQYLSSKALLHCLCTTSMFFFALLKNHELIKISDWFRILAPTRSMIRNP